MADLDIVDEAIDVTAWAELDPLFACEWCGLLSPCDDIECACGRMAWLELFSDGTLAEVGWWEGKL